MEEKENISLQKAVDGAAADPKTQEALKDFNETTKKKNSDSNNDDEQPQKCLKYREAWVESELSVEKSDDGQHTPAD